MSGDDGRLTPEQERELAAYEASSVKSNVVHISKASPKLEKPLIRVGPDIDVQGDLAIAALAADPNIYQQGGQLVHVVRIDPSEATPSKPSGTPEVRRLSAETAREQLARHARWERFDARVPKKGSDEPGRWIACAPPKDVAAAILKRGQWRGIRPLDALTETPVLRPDGTILDKPGYDVATRVVYLLGFEPLPVPAAPTPEQTKAALDLLMDLISEIPFAQHEQRYVFLAALLTLFARPAIRGPAPAFGFDASVPGAGKTLCVQTISCIYVGRPSEPNTYSADPVELEKSLGGEAMSGAPIIDFDNIEDPVEAGPLLKCLTALDKVRLRVMGSNTKVSVKWVAVVLLGGNNLEIGRQMGRRTLVARIEPREENPEEREGFKIADLPTHALEHRSHLIAAVFTLIRAWISAGRPQKAKAMGSYPAWSAVVPQIIQFVAGIDVTKCRPAAGPRRDDPERAAMRALLPLWARLAPEGHTARETLEALYPGGQRPPSVDRQTGQPNRPDGWEGMRAAIEGLCPGKVGFAPTPHALGIRLRKHKGAWFGKQRIVNVEDSDGKNAGKWIVESSP